MKYVIKYFFLIFVDQNWKKWNLFQKHKNENFCLKLESKCNFVFNRGMNWDIFARYLLLIEYGTRWWSKWLACQSIRITICSIGFWITIDRTDYYQLYIGLIVTSLSFIYSPSLEGEELQNKLSNKRKHLHLPGSINKPQRTDLG